MFDEYKNVEEFKEASGYTIDGVWYPRVTKIVSIKAKPALYFFYGEMANYRAGQEVSKKSAEEGTLIHEAVEALLLGKKPEVHHSILPSVRAFVEFASTMRIETKPEFIERRIVHLEHRYAGTIDAMAKINGRFGVLDIKTSRAIYRDYNLQTSAYMEALKDHFENLETRWILRIDQDQTCLRCGATRRTKGGREKVKIRRNGLRPCEVHEWGPMTGQVELGEFPHWQSDFKAFLGAKQLWEWENEEWLKKAGYL